MASVPPIIDIRDDLNRARTETDAEFVEEEFETVRDRLDAFAERDVADREGIVDEIDNQLLRVEERLDQDDPEAARAIQSARNRIHIYRRSVENSDENLAVVESDVRQHEGAAGEQPLPAGEVTMTVTVANAGDDAEVVPVVRFYDEDGDELESVRGPAFESAGGTQAQREFAVDVPTDASNYATSVVENGDSAV